MSYLIRKINKAKWYQIDIEKDDDVSADAITNCLKTTQNCLSVWHIKNEEELDLAVLAIVANQDKLETIDIVILEQNKLQEYNIKIVTSPGNTPISSLVGTHRDLEKLTFSKLGCIKEHIIERIRSDKLKRVTRLSVKKLILEAIENGLVKKEDLNDRLREKLQD